MADGTRIEWTEATWNPITGCSLTSPGCTNCYAMLLAGTRLAGHPSRAGLTIATKAGPVWTGEVRLNDGSNGTPDWLSQPLRWTRARMIFVCAHGDLFHESVPDEWIDRVFAVMALCPQHIFQVLTKRSARMRKYLAGAGVHRPTRVWQAMYGEAKTRTAALNLDSWYGGPSAGQWPLPNVWLGVSVEDQRRADERVPDLLATPAAVRWLSCEPLLGPIDLTEVSDDSTALNPECWGDCACDTLYGYDAGCRRNFGDGSLTRKIDWVVAGGESGPGARPMHPDWARSLRDQCADAGVPFFFKQWGEWAPVCEMTEEAIDACYHPAPEHSPEASRRRKVEQCVLHCDGRRFDGRAMYERPAFEQGSGAMTMMAIGKKRAGRLLDGQLHDGMPQVPA